jgi:lipopolysaccharide export LptBFGC system permease protein LptF
MKKKCCLLEQEVLNSLAAGDFTAEIKQHLKTCPICKESAYLYHWMNGFQKVSRQGKTAEKKLPDVESLWEKAFSLKTPDKELIKKAMKPLRIYQVVSYVIAIIVLLYLVFAHFPGIQASLNLSPVVGMILASLSSMVRTFFKSLSFVFIPIIIGLLSVVIFTIVTGFEPKKSRNTG